MDRPRALGVHVVERHLDDRADPVPVYLVHAERAYAALAQEALFARVDVAQADVDDAVGGQARFDPAELGDGLLEPE